MTDVNGAPQGDPAPETVVNPNAPTNGVEQPTLTQVERDALAKAPDWAKDWTDAERKFYTDKGKPDPNSLFKMHMNADRLISSTQRVTLPKEGDEAAIKAFNKAIGVPETVDGYKLDIPEEHGDPEFAKSFAAAAHSAGLTPAQVTKLNGWWNEQAKTALEAAGKDHTAEFETAKAKGIGELRSAWGAEYQAKFNLADKTASALGFTADMLMKMEGILGTRAMLEKFAEVGGKMAERGFVPGDKTPSGSAMTREEAQDYIQTTRNDPNTFKSLSEDLRNRKDTPAVRKWAAAHSVLQ